MNTQPQYSYADGNGNKYTIHYKNETDILLVYIPVRPENSSSGIYSGGEPIHKKITYEEYKNILHLMENAFANKSVHIENRIMMSGMVIVNDGKEKKTCILKPGCEEMKALEDHLKNVSK